MIFVNFKTYEETAGEKGLNLIRVIEAVAGESQIKIIPAVQVIDLENILEKTKLEIWVQSIDPVDHGAHTGSILAEEVAEAGAKGTLLNHSEKKFNDFNQLSLANEKALASGLKTLIFASDTEELSRVLDLKPTFVSYEPPDLIGSTEVSVSQAKPEIVSQAAKMAKEKGIPLIVGAGIHSGQDVRRSLELGAAGVALATDVVKAQNPREELLDLVKGFAG